MLHQTIKFKFVFIKEPNGPSSCQFQRSAYGMAYNRSEITPNRRKQ